MLKDLPSADIAGWPWTEESLQLPETTPDGHPWPKISIVTPNYNYEAFIEETMRSALLQGCPDFYAIDPELRRNQKSSTEAKSGAILVKEGLWIEAHLLSLKGVSMGNNAIIAIFAGNPAHLIRYSNMPKHESSQ